MSLLPQISKFLLDKRNPAFLELFSGNSIEETRKSYQLALMDCLKDDNSSFRVLSRLLNGAIDSYYCCHYEAVHKRYAEGCASSMEEDALDQFIDQAKKADKDIESLRISLSSVDTTDYEIILVSNHEHDISPRSRFYLPKQYTMVINLITNNKALVDSFESTVAYSSFLQTALVFIYGSLSIKEDQKKFLASVVLSLSKLYTQAFPGDSSRRRYRNSLLSIMTDPKNLSTQPDDFNFEDLWDRFVEDLHDGKLPYVADLSKAIDHCKSLIHKYTYDDYYFSNRGSAATVTIRELSKDNSTNLRNKKKKTSCRKKVVLPKGLTYNRPVPSYESAKKSISKSLPGMIRSIFEDDPLKDYPEVKAFDDYIGYISHYNFSTENYSKLHSTSIDESTKTSKNSYRIFDYNNNEYQIDIINNNARIVTIDNPNKYKPRIIHVLSNALQDRTNWIQRVLEDVCDHIKGDATNDQSKMIRFSIFNSHDKYISTHHNDFYCWDFESATDLADQKQTKAVLDLFFPEVVSNFWTFLCNMEQKVLHIGKDEDDLLIKQVIGQLQGALASFRIFTLTHHVIMRLEMLATGRTNLDPEDFYCIVGDDNICNSITPTSVISNNNEVGFRTDLEIAHRNICSVFGYKVNTDKSVFNYYDQWAINRFPYKAEAIHNVISGGEIITAIPCKLLMNYSNPARAIAAAIWGSSHNYPKEVMMRIIRQSLIRFLDEKPSSNMLKHIREAINDQETKFKFLEVIFILLHGGVSEYLDNLMIRSVNLALSDSDYAILYALNSFVRYKTTIYKDFFGDYEESEGIDASITIESILDNTLSSFEDAMNHYFKTKEISLSYDNIPEGHKMALLKEEMIQRISLNMEYRSFMCYHEGDLENLVMLSACQPKWAKATRAIAGTLEKLHFYLNDRRDNWYDPAVQESLKLLSQDSIKSFGRNSMSRSPRRGSHSEAIQIIGSACFITSTMKNCDEFWVNIDYIYHSHIIPIISQI